MTIEDVKGNTDLRKASVGPSAPISQRIASIEKNNKKKSPYKNQSKKTSIKSDKYATLNQDIKHFTEEPFPGNIKGVEDKSNIRLNSKLNSGRKEIEGHESA